LSAKECRASGGKNGERCKNLTDSVIGNTEIPIPGEYQRIEEGGK